MQLFAFAALTLSAFAAGALWMQDTKTERFAYPKSKDADGGMARWIQTCKPGPAHARLKELLGDYELVHRMQMAPGAPPMESKGSMQISWLVEGKWLVSKTSFEMFGRKVDATAILGYDNFKERFVWCTVDSLTTALNTASGLFDQAGNNLTLWGTIDEPGTPEQDKTVKYVYRGFGQDKLTFEVHDMMIGEPNTKVVEFEATRRK